MIPTRIIDKIVDSFIKICGKEFVFTDLEYLEPYGKDCTQKLSYNFDILVKPANVDEVSAIVKQCNKYKVPLTPRGGGSGVTGGALPIRRGVVLSLERLNQIISLDRQNKYITVEAGLITDDLLNYIKNENFYFPIFPTSSYFSTVGGNVSENAGGIKSCKYGSTLNFVVNLEVVLPSGEIIWTSANVNKNVSGLNITPLFVGGEGILGIITKIVYRLLSIPISEVLILASFDKLESALDALNEIRKNSILPSAGELICNNALKLTSKYLNKQLDNSVDAHLIIGIEENSLPALDFAIQSVHEILNRYTSSDQLIAYSSSEKERILELRLNIGNALTDKNYTYRDIDIAVPFSFLYQYIKGVEQICLKYNVPLVCFGHALDGNLHSMLLIDQIKSNDENESFDCAVNEIYEFAIKNGGVISGEHGIGYLQQEFISLQFTHTQLELMKKIKVLFDPNNILNPGKFLQIEN